MMSELSNNRVQATPDCALMFFVAQVSGAPESERWGERGIVKSTVLLLAASTFLTACRHADVAHQPLGTRNPNGTFTGRTGTSAESVSVFFSPRTPAEVTANAKIVQHIVGAWIVDKRPDTDEYQAITIRPDGTFTATNGNKQLSGAWCVDRGVLFLGKQTPLRLLTIGFHPIDLVNEHQLVCGIGMSVAGRMRFTR
jgi:hypothetical protein